MNKQFSNTIGRKTADTMSYLFTIQQATDAHTDRPLPKDDTYANAILRTLSSFKIPPPPMPSNTCRRHHRLCRPSKMVSQSVVNEVSGIKTRTHT